MTLASNDELQRLMEADLRLMEAGDCDDIDWMAPDIELADKLLAHALHQAAQEAQKVPS